MDASIHLGVCAERDRDQYSRMAEDGSSPVAESIEFQTYPLMYCKYTVVSHLWYISVC